MINSRPTVLFLLFFICGCGTESQRYTFQAAKMGSVFSITLFAPDSAKAREVAEKAFSRIDEINLALSDFTEESETWQINAHPTKEWIDISDDLFRMLQISVQVAGQTDGAFDPAVGNLVQLWRRARRRQELPTKDALDEALARAGYHHIELDESKRRVRFTQKGIKLDFGGIGKGYAMDEALKILQQNGFKISFVSASSSIAAGEAPPDKKSWEFSLAHGEAGEEGVGETIHCNNCFIASSGDLYQYMEVGEKRYSHIIDPFTGMALTNSAFAIVVAPSATLADAYATAFCVMGMGEVGAFLDEHSGVHAKVWKNEGGELKVLVSEKFAAYTKTPLTLP